MPRFVSGPVRVRTPATSANLGPGFDTAGLALALHDEVVVSVAPSGLHVDVSGEGSAALPRGERHLVVSAMRAAFDRLGGSPAGLVVRAVNRIPQSRGLGSSSAAIVAGVLAARALVRDGNGLLDDDAVLALADELEGHPDNVAACLRGGLTLAYPGADGVRVLRLAASPDLLPVALVPSTRSSTKQVRGLLPAQVPHADAATNAARAALLPLALTSRPDLLMAATEDLLHQPYRARAMRPTADLVAALRARGVPAVVSGAGPTVLALTSRQDARTVAYGAPAGWRALVLEVDAGGACVVPLS